MNAALAILSQANAVGAVDTHECQHCGRVYDEPVPENGCFSDDCPGHDAPSELELMQWQAEDNLHRAKGRYVRPARAFRPVTR